MRQATRIIVLGLFILLGCEELEQPATNQFVVEAFITAGEPINNIKIKESASLDAEVLEDIPIADATIRLFSGSSEVTLDYNTSTSKYFLGEGDFNIEIGGEYSIQIDLGDVSATAETIVPEQPTGLTLSDTVLVVPTLRLSPSLREQFETLFEEERSTLIWDGVPGRSYYVVIETQEEEIEQILPSEIPQESLDLIASFRFISEPSEETSFDIIAVALETYGKHVAKVYTVNEEYAELFNSATQDSRDLNEPPSNVTNALGIFSSFAVDSIEFELRR